MVKSTITVNVKLFGDLRKYRSRGAPETAPVELSPGATVADLAARLGMTRADEVIAGVNGDQAQEETVLHDGDQVLLVSPMEGGR